MGQHQQDVHQIDHSPRVRIHRSRFHPVWSRRVVRSISVRCKHETNEKENREKEKDLKRDFSDIDLCLYGQLMRELWRVLIKGEHVLGISLKSIDAVLGIPVRWSQTIEEAPPPPVASLSTFFCSDFFSFFPFCVCLSADLKLRNGKAGGGSEP